jgi:hypothetical protein
MVRRATGPQIFVVSVLTTLALVGGVIFSAGYANLTLSARDVGGLIMPPGMIMTRETSAAAMRGRRSIRAPRSRSPLPMHKVITRFSPRSAPAAKRSSTSRPVSSAGTCCPRHR